MYKGVGSVVVGSAPGGEAFFSPICIRSSRIYLKIFTSVAAVFFSTYDTLKRTIPLSPAYDSLTHMIAASIAEVVRSLSSLTTLSPCKRHTPLAGGLPHPRPHGSREKPRADVDVWECDWRGSGIHLRRDDEDARVANGGAKGVTGGRDRRIL